VGPGRWRQTGSSRNRRGLFKGTPGESKNVMHLFAADRREPLQKLVNGGAPIDVLEQRGNRQAGAAEAPCPAKLPWAPVGGTAKASIHTVGLSLTLLYRFETPGRVVGIADMCGLSRNSDLKTSGGRSPGEPFWNWP
jgi:hypothetical protein